MRFKLGGRDVMATVIEDRGSLGIGGVQLLRVRLTVSGTDEVMEFEVPASEVRAAAWEPCAMDHNITMTIDGVEYIALPVAEYRRLSGETPSAQEEGIAWARAQLGKTLRRAREHAGFSQAALAKKLKKSQTLVARAESGDVRVSERYVATVLKACKLPADWSASGESAE